MCNECHLVVHPNVTGIAATTVTFVDDEARFHCLDGPAILWEDGTMIYYRHGERHRDGDLPAVIWSDGATQYWVNGEFIRRSERV